MTQKVLENRRVWSHPHNEQQRKAESSAQTDVTIAPMRCAGNGTLTTNNYDAMMLFAEKESPEANGKTTSLA